jgi:hypothetical protein
MVIHGRNLKLLQVAKGAPIDAGTISTLSVRALSKGFLTAFDFSTRAREVYDDLAEDDPIAVTTLSQSRANPLEGQEIWVD